MRKGAWAGVWQMDVGVGGGVGMLYLEKRRRESRRRRRRYGVVGVEPSEARPWCNVQPCRLLSFFQLGLFFSGLPTLLRIRRILHTHTPSFLYVRNAIRYSEERNGATAQSPTLLFRALARPWLLGLPLTHSWVDGRLLAWFVSRHAQTAGQEMPEPNAPACRSTLTTPSQYKPA